VRPSRRTCSLALSTRLCPTFLLNLRTLKIELAVTCNIRNNDHRCVGGARREWAGRGGGCHGAAPQCSSPSCCAAHARSRWTLRRRMRTTRLRAPPRSNRAPGINSQLSIRPLRTHPSRVLASRSAPTAARLGARPGHAEAKRGARTGSGHRHARAAARAGLSRGLAAERTGARAVRSRHRASAAALAGAARGAAPRRGAKAIRVRSPSHAVVARRAGAEEAAVAAQEGVEEEEEEARLKAAKHQPSVRLRV
jgi:hypothetical protein